MASSSPTEVDRSLSPLFVSNGGYVVKSAIVTVHPKMVGQTIRFSVSDENVRTHAGIPVFGLYPDYLNTVEVEYDRVYKDKTEHFSSTRRPSSCAHTARTARRTRLSKPRSKRRTRTSATVSTSSTTRSLPTPIESVVCVEGDERKARQTRKCRAFQGAVTTNRSRRGRALRPS